MNRHTIQLSVALILSLMLLALPVLGAELEPIEFPEDGNIENLQMLEDYAETLEVDRSDASPEEKSKAWRKLARKWKRERAVVKQAKARAVEWLRLNKTQERLDKEWPRLQALAANEVLSVETRRAAVEEFLKDAPTWWEHRAEAEALLAQLEAGKGPAKKNGLFSAPYDKRKAKPAKPEEEPEKTAPPEGPTAEEPEVAAPEKTVPAEPEAAVPVDAPDDEATTEAPPPVDGPAVKDFCGIGKSEVTDRFVRQRLVVFPLAGTEIVETGEIDVDGATQVNFLKGVEGARLFGEMFRSYFPMKRFETVLAGAPAPVEWKEAESLTLEEMSEKVPDEFDSYSLACADYLVFGEATEFKGVWTEAEVENPETGKKEKIHTLDATVDGWLMVFRREGDGFVTHAELEAGSGGLLGFVSGFASSISGQVSDPTGVADSLDDIGRAKAMEYVSLRPGEACSVPSAPKDGTAGLSCAGALDSLPELPGPPGMGEASKPLCKEFKIIRERPNAAICGIRKSGELFAVSAQKEARSVDGWRLFTPLEPRKDTGEPALSLGDGEGVYRGMGFHAVRVGEDGEKELLAYGKITELGPGGAEGMEDPSVIGWRIDTGEAGVRMEEHPQIGFTAGLEPLAFFPLLGDKANVVMDDQGNEAKYPPALMGIGLDVGYDLTRYLFSEMWLRFRADFGISPTKEYQLWVLNLQLGPEVRLFMANRMYWHVSLVGNMTITGLKSFVDNTAIDLYGKEEMGTGNTGGIEVRTGFDLMINADVYMRLSVGWLQNFSKVTYEKDDKVLFLREDFPAGLMTLLSVNYTL